VAGRFVAAIGTFPVDFILVRAIAWLQTKVCIFVSDCQEAFLAGLSVNHMTLGQSHLS
jgi:hypothetical protein